MKIVIGKTDELEQTWHDQKEFGLVFESPLEKDLNAIVELARELTNDPELKNRMGFSVEYKEGMTRIALKPKAARDHFKKAYDQIKNRIPKELRPRIESLMAQG
ncbi:MAG TPA: hypothetical protein VMB46_05590 [Methanomassiliicoccales archaeon]|nr:hypothetical protein [Methanomassiliicoccales archaeon]